ncbi:phage tail protein [Latilactobacillus curvatus]|uniref:phage tail spike protein n=1 Tax=Latilactobacillus curvatus TaxID=28038 RepID=UPI0022F3EB17|nr:phage tail spike protein [Latilactobacillus curvatus]WBY48098.1 phage tail protein [Latilactobacillus curvatus]
MIRLFDKDETNFNSNGLGVLDPAIKENVVEEKMNGIYNFDFAYLSKGKHASQLEGDMIIKAPTPDGDQLFRVYKVTKNIGFLEVNCYHIFYDLAGNFIEDTNIVSQSGQAAITHFGTGLQYATRFNFVSNIVGTNSARMVRLNAVQALLDSSQDNSFLSRWGGEIKRDNFTIYMNDVRGNDKGFKIRHGKNLTGYEANIDYSSVVTRIMPYGYNGLMLPEKYVDSPLRGKYAFTRIKKIEYTNIKAIDPDATSNDESAVPLEEAYKLLRQAAALEYSVNKVDIPTSNFKVTFKNLADTKEYADFKALEKVEPWDYVTVIADNLDIKSRMISYKYDAITRAYKEVELGNYVPSFSDTNTETNNKLSNINNDLNNINNDLNTVAETANGKNSNYYGSAEPNHPVDGDLWYKKNGDKTELWRYDGKSVPPGWKLVVDDATGEEVRQNVDAAQKEAEEAKNQANKAVDGANDAVAKAGFATDTATQAKSDAASALQKALDAYNHGDQIKTGLTADIDAVKGQVNLKANQVDVDKLGGRVTNAEAQIKLQADQIKLTVSKTELTNVLGDYATQTWTQSQIKTTADAINLSVSQVQSNLDNLNIEDRNLYLGTKTMKGWQKRGNATLITLDGEYVTDVGGDWAALWNPVHLEKGKKYKWSIDYKGIVNTGIQLYLYVSPINGAAVIANIIARDLQTVWNRAYGEFVSPFTGDAMVRSEVANGDWATLKHVYTRHIKLSQSDKDTGWSEAPEDSITDIEFSKLQVTVNGIQGTVQNKADQSQVTQLANQITSTVHGLGQKNLLSNSTFDDLTSWYDTGGHWEPKAWGYNGSQGAIVDQPATASWDELQHIKIPYNDYMTAISASVRMKVNRLGTGASCRAIIRFYDSTGKTISGYDLTGYGDKIGIWYLMKKENIAIPQGTSQIMLLFTANSDVRAIFSQPMLVADAVVGAYSQDDVSQSQITQLANDINLRVQKGDVIGQINIEAGKTLIQNNNLILDAKTVTFTGSAFIPNAAITSIDADKITAGTLNAANVNVINLNANNITTGTIKGANLSMNLNTGEVVFQHGRIHSTSNNVDVNIDQGYLSTASNDTRVMLKEGQLQLVQPTIFDNSKDPYLEISNSVGGASFNGANIIARDYLVLANRSNSDAFFDSPIDGPETFAGVAVGKSNSGRWLPTRIGGAERGVVMRGGIAYKAGSGFMFKNSPDILVGTDKAGLKPSDRIHINGSYVHIESAYWRTASGSANVIVAQDGALVRSTSASKYKTDIIRTNIPDYGEKLLNLPTATWTDIAETKRYQENPTTQPKPTRNFGMIAEDLADAGLEMLVVRGADGELEGINYDRIGPALIPVIAKLKNEVETLKQKLEEKTA